MKMVLWDTSPPSSWSAGFWMKSLFIAPTIQLLICLLSVQQAVQAWTQLLFIHSVVSVSSRPHRLQHARLPCPPPSPRVCSNFMSIELVMPSNHLILCPPLLLPSIFPSIRVFSSELTLRIRWPKYWSFSFSISPSNEYSGLNSFRID